MITEDEAQKRWCPFARQITAKYGGGKLGPYNRIVGIEEDCINHDNVRCIASDCMAWDGVPAMHDVDTGKECSPPIGRCGLTNQTDYSLGGKP